MNNPVFIKYLQQLVNYNGIEEAIREIDAFINTIRSTSPESVSEASDFFIGWQNRYRAWLSHKDSMDSRDSRIERAQIMNALVAFLGDLAALPDIQYTGQKDLEATLASVKKRYHVKRYWLIPVLLLVGLAGVAIYRYLQPEPPVIQPPKKALTLVLHESGDQKVRPLYSQGRLAISDTTGKHMVSANIDNSGLVRFDSLADWVFNTPGGAAVYLQNVDESKFLLRYEDVTYHFQPNDTFYIELRKILPPPPTDSIPKEDTNGHNGNADPVDPDLLQLQFYHQNLGTYRSFSITKKATIEMLKDKIRSRFPEVMTGFVYGDQMGVRINGTPVWDNKLVLADIPVENGDEIAVMRMSTVRIRPITTIIFHGIKFSNPVVKIGNNANFAKHLDANNELSVSCYLNTVSDSILVLLTNNKEQYKFKVLVTQGQTLRVNLQQYKASSYIPKDWKILGDRVLPDNQPFKKTESFTNSRTPTKLQPPKSNKIGGQ